MLLSSIEGKSYCSNSKEIVNISNQEKLLTRNDLEKNEWIETFFMFDENTIVMFNGFTTSKNILLILKNYEIDSTINKQIKIIDRVSKNITER